MQDGKQGISHDRILMRVKDYIQIATALGGFLYGGLQIVRAFDRMNQQVEILQEQVSRLQQMVVTGNNSRK